MNPAPEGMIEYEVRNGIRDLCRLYGKEEARRLVAEMINEEMLGHPGWLQVQTNTSEERDAE